jgi:hypothetical protein
MNSWAKAKKLTDQHFRPRLTVRSLGREAAPIGVPETLLAAQRDGCLVLLAVKRVAVKSAPALYRGLYITLRFTWKSRQNEESTSGLEPLT